MYSSVESHTRYPGGSDGIAKGGNPGREFYHVFNNVRVQYLDTGELGVLFLHSFDMPTPDAERIHRIWFNYEDTNYRSVAVEYEGVHTNDTILERCRDSWVNKPAIIFDIPFSSNIFHIFNDGILSVFQTLRDLKLLPTPLIRLLDSDLKTQRSLQAGQQLECSVSGSAAEVALISMQSQSFENPWSFMLNHISMDQSVFSAMAGVCFRTLVVGGSGVANMFVTSHDSAFLLCSPDAAVLTAREHAIEAFQPFAFSSALTHKLERMHVSAPLAELWAALCRDLPPARPGIQDLTSASRVWASGDSLPQVTLASRALPSSRALVNEAQIMAYISARWEVETVTTHFEGALFESIDLMRRSDVFLGMHGAGWTNALFLPTGSVAVQLIPYGWQVEDGSAFREGLYKSIVLARNSTYFRWSNKNSDDAFLRRNDFQDKMESYTLHPAASDRPDDDPSKSYMVYQNTIARLEAIIPTLEAAFTAASITERVSWRAAGDALLAQLQAETETIRREFSAPHNAAAAYSVA